MQTKLNHAQKFEIFYDLNILNQPQIMLVMKSDDAIFVLIKNLNIGECIKKGRGENLWMNIFQIIFVK